MKRWVWLTVMLLASPAWGEPVEVARAIVGTARGAAKIQAHQHPQTFDTFVRRQAALELQLGLRLYETKEDWRAITALRRHMLLSGTPASEHLAGLIIGQIYERNQRPAPAALAYERAVPGAPSPAAGVWSYLLATQQLCLPMSLYVACRARLKELSDQAELTRTQRELVTYQRLFVDVVLRRENLSPRRLEGLQDPILRSHGEALLAQDRAFEDLDTKNPWLATGLSIVPGVGQLYNGRPAEAAVAFGLNAGFGALTYFSFAQWDAPALGIASAVLLTSVYVGNLVNAHVDAERITAAAYQSFFEGLGRAHWPRVGFQIERDRVFFGYTFDWPGETLEASAPSEVDEVL